MLKLRHTALMLILCCSENALGHVDHDSDGDVSQVPPSTVPYSSVSWQSRLDAFSTQGTPADLAAAELIGQTLLRENPSSPEYLYLAARTAQAGHRFADAHAHLNRLHALAPRHSAGQLLQAGIWLVQSQYAKARSHCARLANVSPVVVVTCYAWSNPAPTLKDYNSLVGLIERGLAERESNEVHAWVIATAADIATKLGDDDLAVAHYRHAIGINPTTQYQIGLVQGLLKTGKLNAALHEVPQDAASIGLQVKRLVILQRMNQLDSAAGMVRGLERRFSNDIITDDYTHGREMAEFYLDVLLKPHTAREILAKSRLMQQEFEDNQLWQRATMAIALRHHMASQR